MSTAVTINDIFPKLQYVAANGQTTFTYNFPIFSASDLAVYRTPAGQTPDDAGQRLALNSDYTVSGIEDENGGTVDMLIAINAGDRITIQRAMPYNRLSSYKNGRRFNADSLDYDFNALLMMVQQIWAYYEKRFPHYENTIIDDTANLRLPVLRDGQYWKRNATGIVAVTDVENPDTSTFRSELANQEAGTDGSRLIGYHDTIFGNMSVHDALERFYANYATDTGTEDRLAANFTPAYAAYRVGMQLFVKVANFNTGDTTINIDGLGQKHIKLNNGKHLYMGNLVPGMVAHLFYDGSNFILLNPETSTMIGFRATLSAPVSLSTNVYTQYINNTVVFNEGSRYNSLTGEFTASENGIYMFVLSGEFTVAASEAGAVTVQIRKNGTSISAGDLAYSTNIFGTLTGNTPTPVIEKLQAGDVISAYAFHNFTTGSLTPSDQTYFCGALIARLP